MLLCVLCSSSESNHAGSPDGLNVCLPLHAKKKNALNNPYFTWLYYGNHFLSKKSRNFGIKNLTATCDVRSPVQSGLNSSGQTTVSLIQRGMEFYYQKKKKYENMPQVAGTCKKSY